MFIFRAFEARAAGAGRPPPLQCRCQQSGVAAHAGEIENAVREGRLGQRQPLDAQPADAITTSIATRATGIRNRCGCMSRLPANARDPLPAIAVNAMSHPADLPQLLDIEMQEIARRRPFVPVRGTWGLQPA